MPDHAGTLVRFLVRQGLDAAVALATLDVTCGRERHVFWADDRPYDAGALRGVIGHRQVIDGYLAALGRARRGRLASFDKGLAIAHADVVELLPGA